MNSDFIYNQNNVAVEKDGKFPCNYCSKSYSRKTDVLRHEQHKHRNKLSSPQMKRQKKVRKMSTDEEEEEKTEADCVILTCDVCQSQFKNKLEMFKHFQEAHSDLFNFGDELTGASNSKSRAKRYFCNICSHLTKGRKSYLAHHKLEHQGQKLDFIRETPKHLHHCEFEPCSSAFTRIHDLYRHQRKKHPQLIIILENRRVLRKRILCQVCNAEFGEQEEAKLHVRSEHDSEENDVLVWACSLCEGRFDSVTDVVAHGNLLHIPEIDGSKADIFGVSQYSKKPCVATCDVCGLTFKQRYQLTTHKSRHITMEHRLKYKEAAEACKVLINCEPHFRCNVCSRMFSKEDAFIRHLLLHDVGRAFCCHLCGFQCFTQAHLNRHMNVVHLKKRDFKCDICGHAFAEKQAMADHRRTHTGERPCQCKICGKMFPSWTCVYTHKRSHTDYFPYRCTEPNCKSKFRTKYRFTEHMRRHTGEKPFSCPIETCDKTFHDKRSISRHLTVHTDERPHACSLCNRTYKHKKYLSFHMKTNHGVTMSQFNEQTMACNLNG